ncbi:MAG: hypothetical protein QM796_11400 [Chthoniobacteraceae bacterium]
MLGNTNPYYQYAYDSDFELAQYVSGTATYQPDASIGLSTTSLVGANIYNTTAAGQTVSSHQATNQTKQISR